MTKIIYLLTIVFFSVNMQLYSLDAPLNLIIKDISYGDDDSLKAKGSKLLSVNYTGWLFNPKVDTKDYCKAKGQIFDSNTLDKFNHKAPFQFVLGSGVVIKGWEMGLENMKINDVRCLVIPPKLAYGNRKMGNILEANSTLIFEIQLLDIISLDTEDKD
jgi:FKBP-type peptidyl-prolyl cis-trans isomerase